MRTTHIKSNVVNNGVPKLPTSDAIYYGEIAINYGASGETLSIKNSNDEIVPLLKDLAHAKKQIVIATHDANIAIRTRPSSSILKIVDNENYKTYIGNMFTDILCSIDSSEKLSWKDESIKYLEGGKVAFDERGDLYEKWNNSKYFNWRRKNIYSF